jgi:hypothetical protein
MLPLTNAKLVNPLIAAHMLRADGVSASRSPNRSAWSL